MFARIFWISWISWILDPSLLLREFSTLLSGGFAACSLGMLLAAGDKPFAGILFGDGVENLFGGGVENLFGGGDEIFFGDSFLNEHTVTKCNSCCLNTVHTYLYTKSEYFFLK